MEVMGMPITIDVRNSDCDARTLEPAFAEFRLLDRIFSPFREDSAVSRVNRGELTIGYAGEEVRRAIEIGRLYEQATQGYFALTLNGRFDPSGLIKSWAIDRASTILEGGGARSYFIDAGGDVLARGGNGAGEPWRIGIRHPIQRDRFVRILHGQDLAVATSGTYEKGPHVLNPHTGQPALESISATVVGPDILTADVYATAVLAMGRRGLEFVAQQPGYEAYVISSELVGSLTPAFDSHCIAAPAGI